MWQVFLVVAGLLGVVVVLTRKERPETPSDESFLESMGKGCLTVIASIVVYFGVGIAVFFALHSPNESNSDEQEHLVLALFAGLVAAGFAWNFVYTRLGPKRDLWR